MQNKICINDRIRQCGKYWMRTQIFIPNDLYGDYFGNNNKLLAEEKYLTIICTISNSWHCSDFAVIARHR